MMPALLKSMCDNLTAKIDYNTQQIEQKTAESNTQIMNQNIAYHQNDLQDGLYQVLRATNISPQLSKLNNSLDLLPCGYKITNNMMIYGFLWTKNNTDVIPPSMLKLFTQKMNIAINSQRYKFFAYLQQLDEVMQAYNIQLYSALYNGFRVCGCKDNGDSIILAVTY